MINASDSHFYLNAQGLNDLKRAAREDGKGSLKAVAKQFESMMLSMLMKSMRGSGGQSVLDNESTRLYTDMLDQQFSQQFAAGKGLGLADMLVNQLSRAQVSFVPQEDRAKEPVALKRAAQTIFHSRGLPGGAQTPLPVPKAPEPESKPLTPKDFVERFTPLAAEAARELGVPSQGILAQAALESGWGKREINHHDGSASRNLFGIKADANWTGRVAETTTTEYVNGQAVTRTARFRAYDSYEEAFQDYTALLKRSPRYQAVRDSDDPAIFARRLQQSGYATDPRYADKLNRVMASAALLAGTTA